MNTTLHKELDAGAKGAGQGGDMDEISDDARNYLSRIGRKGGSAKTPAKSEAAYKREAKHRAEREAAEAKNKAKGKL